MDHTDMDKPAAGQPDPEMGAVTGLPLDLPFGRHPFDWYLAALNATLGPRKTARYLGVEHSPGAGPVGHGETPEHHR